MQLQLQINVINSNIPKWVSIGSPNITVSDYQARDAKQPLYVLFIIKR